MKTFTATRLNKKPAPVFDAAKEDGSALIEHDRYPGGVFAIRWEPDLQYAVPLVSKTREEMEAMYPVEDKE